MLLQIFLAGDSSNPLGTLSCRLHELTSEVLIRLISGHRMSEFNRGPESIILLHRLKVSLCVPPASLSLRHGSMGVGLTTFELLITATAVDDLFADLNLLWQTCPLFQTLQLAWENSL